MTRQPSALEQAPIIFSLLGGLLAGCGVLVWALVSPLAGVIVWFGALCALVLRIWIPIARRRKYGY